MKILIVSTFFPPQNSIASLRPYSWAKHWALAGHEVTVLTTKKISDPSTDLQFSFDNFEVIEVELPQFVTKMKSAKNAPAAASSKSTKSFFKNAINTLQRKTGIFYSYRFPDLTHFFWIKRALKAVEGNFWDLVISSFAPYTVHLLAEKLKRKGKTKKWIADYRDKWSNSHIYPGLFPFNHLEKAWEDKLLRSADAITTVSAPYATSFVEKYGAGKVHVVENGFDPNDLADIPPIPIFLNDKKFRIVHTGSVYLQNQRPELLFEAIQELSQDLETKELLNHLEVIFVGPNQEPIEKMASKYGVHPWVNALGFVNREVALRMQRDAHALLFFPWSDPAHDGVFSGKIFEYLYSRTPVLGIGQDTENFSSTFIKEAGIGKTLTNSDEIIEYLKENLSNINKAAVVPAQGTLERFDRRSLALKMLSIAERIG